MRNTPPSIKKTLLGVRRFVWNQSIVYRFSQLPHLQGMAHGKISIDWEGNEDEVGEDLAWITYFIIVKNVFGQKNWLMCSNKRDNLHAYEPNIQNPRICSEVVVVLMLFLFLLFFFWFNGTWSRIVIGNGSIDRKSVMHSTERYVSVVLCRFRAL